MGITAEQLQMAGLIDDRMKAIARSGVDDFAIFAEMADYMPAFKRLMDTSTDEIWTSWQRVIPGSINMQRSLKRLRPVFNQEKL
jgi:hypothetical protein